MSPIVGASSHFGPANPISLPWESGAQSICQSCWSLIKITKSTKEEQLGKDQAWSKLKRVQKKSNGQGPFPFLSAYIYVPKRHSTLFEQPRSVIIGPFALLLSHHCLLEPWNWALLAMKCWPVEHHMQSHISFKGVGYAAYQTTNHTALFWQKPMLKETLCLESVPPESRFWCFLHRKCLYFKSQAESNMSTVHSLVLSKSKKDIPC